MAMSSRWALVPVVAIAVSGCAIVEQPVLRPFADGQEFQVLRPLPYELRDTTQRIVVPSGFVTDLASIPRAFWVLLPKNDRHMVAAIVHDYLYWKQTCSRDEADEVLRLAMRDARVPKWKEEVIYRAVRLGGGAAWQSNASARAAGRLRIIPPAHENVPPDSTWQQYQEVLLAKGILASAEDAARIDPHVCASVRSRLSGPK